MAKPYNKRPNDYFNLIATKELIKAITIKNGIANSQLVITERGGLNPGTWMHDKLALKFAIWCNSQINQSSIKAGIPVTLYFK
ncbi:hypothetical protein CMU20_17515 [Elizabethkingia anophelis]|nr:hypothetical protein [Elizabethkingia anophelis]